MVDQLSLQLEKHFSEMIALRRFFHQYPELSFQEVKTPAKINEFLTSLGIVTKTKVGGRGVIGIIEGGMSGKTVALRADFDALPIQDEKTVDYASKVQGVMHACGHDAHTATLLYVAKVLQENRKQLKGRVILIFQFAEEVAPGGAKPMIEDGCLDGVDVIFGTHLWSTIPVGKMGYRSGPIMAAADQFTIEIQGKGGHGAAPHETVDAIILGTTYIQMIQQIVSRNVNPITPAVITVGSFHAGDAFNIIADKAKIVGTVRTFDETVQNLIIEKLESILKSICEAAGAEYTFDYVKGYPAVINHENETNILVQSAKKIMNSDDLFEMEPQMGGEDFAYYLQKVPGSFFFIGAGNDEVGASFPHHHPKFNIDEKAMLNAGKVLLSVTIDYLEGNG